MVLDAAAHILNANSDKGADDWVGAWLDVQFALANVHYWRNEAELQSAVLARVRTVVEARGTAGQKAHFYTWVGVQRFRASRYVIDESILADLRSGCVFVVEGGLENELYCARFRSRLRLPVAWRPRRRLRRARSRARS